MVDNRNLSISVIAGLLRCSDIIAVALAGLLSFYSRFGALAPDGNWSLVIVFVTVAAANVFHILKLYEYDQIIRDPMQLRRLGLALLAIAFLTLAVGYLTKTSIQFSRIWMSTWGLYATVFLVAIRIGLRFKFKRWQARGWLTRRVAVVGAGPQGQRVVRHFLDANDPSVDLIGVFDDRRSRVPNQIGDSPVRGTVDDLLDVVRGERVDEVIVALPWSAESRILELLQKLRSAPIHVRLSPEAIAFRFPHRATTAMQGVNMLNVYDRPLSSWSSVVKRIEDQVLSILILAFISPLILLIAIAIKIDSRGPVLFRQRRYGFNNELFEVLKFRSLYADQLDRDANKLVTRDDPRVTRVGRFLRKSSLDELPQFFNVLRGEMSIVGPRAHALKAKADGLPYEEIVAEYFARHRVKPGITGWAQVSGWRGETDTQEKIERRIEYDLEYIDRWSVWFDLKIMIMTPFVMLFAKGNY